jgi:hypothetical protein
MAVKTTKCNPRVDCDIEIKGVTTRTAIQAVQNPLASPCPALRSAKRDVVPTRNRLIPQREPVE